jgi:lysophospholipase L1-like esterase
MTASLLLLAASLALTFGVGEVLVRALGYHGAPESVITNAYRVDDSVLDWRYVPNSEVKAGRVVYRYNAAGYRDGDHAVEKPAAVKRIVVVGDSVSEGYGVEWPEVFASALQSRLGSAWEVINLAAGGLNTRQEVHLFERDGRRYAPDRVIVNFVLNDADFDSKLQGAQRYIREKDARIGLINLPVDPTLKRWLKSSALVYLVKERLEFVKARVVGADEADHFSRVWAQEANREKVRTALGRLAAVRDEDRFDVVLVIWPVLTDFQRYRFQAIHDWVAGEARRVGFSVVDLLPAFSRLRYETLQVAAEDNVHPNARGHALAVQAVAPILTRSVGVR